MLEKGVLFRQLEYFVALAREQHFAHAAAACHVSQPALSESLRKLEHELSVPLVKRGSNYEGLTAEGERLLRWALRILADRDAMRSEVTDMRTGLTGQLRIGVIPAATASVAGLVDRFSRRHGMVDVRIQSGLTSVEIVERVRTFEVEVGVVFSDAAQVSEVLATPLYEEHHVLVIPPGLQVDDDAPTLDWDAVGTLPLCLLHKGMRGRDLLDEAAAVDGFHLQPRIETDSVSTLLALVRTGHWASIVPRSRVTGGNPAPDLRIVELPAPPLGRVAVIRSAREPAPLLATAFLDSLRPS